MVIKKRDLSYVDVGEEIVVHVNVDGDSRRLVGEITEIEGEKVEIQSEQNKVIVEFGNITSSGTVKVIDGKSTDVIEEGDLIKINYNQEDMFT